MPDVYRDPGLADPAHDPYWDRKPADHNPAGFFVDGPQRAIPPLNKQAHSGRWHRVAKFTDAAPAEPRASRAADLARRVAAAHRLLHAVRKAA
jgi:hypothetical protein